MGLTTGTRKSPSEKIVKDVKRHPQAVLCRIRSEFSRERVAQHLTYLALCRHVVEQSETHLWGCAYVGFQCRGIVASRLQRMTGSRQLAVE
jgi:hypothetical protein